MIFVADDDVFKMEKAMACMFEVVWFDCHTSRTTVLFLV